MCSEFADEVYTGIGRPRIVVNIEEVEYLRSLRLKWKDIAEVLDISRQTLYRRLREEGLLEDLQFTDISNDDLDDNYCKGY